MGAQNTLILIMKFLVLAACVAVSSAQLVTYPNGAQVPVDTAEVQAAKVAHAAAGGAIHPYGFGYYAYAHPAGLVAHANGAVVPVEPADVQAARAEHLAAHASA